MLDLEAPCPEVNLPNHDLEDQGLHMDYAMEKYQGFECSSLCYLLVITHLAKGAQQIENLAFLMCRLWAGLGAHHLNPDLPKNPHQGICTSCWEIRPK